MKRILITMAGGLIGRNHVRALRAAEPLHIIAADANGYSLFLSDAEERYIIPRADDPNYMKLLRDLVNRTKPDLVWPLHDNEIGRIVGDDRELGARTFLPPRETVEICHNKYKSYKAFKAAGVPVAETMMLNSDADLSEAFEKLGGHIWIRPVAGAGARGALGTDNPELAKIWIDDFEGWGHYSASVRLAKRGHTFESVWRDGNLIVGQANSRNVATERVVGALSNGPPSGAGVRRRHGAEENVKEIAIAAIHAVTNGPPHGIYSVDMTSDHEGVPNVTEINIGRFGMAGSVVYYDHGANFPAIALRSAFGEGPGFEPPLLNPFRTDVGIVLAVGSPPVPVTDEEYEPLEQEYRSRSSQYSGHGAN